MNDIFSAMKKYSKEVATYALYATSLFCLLYHVGNFGDSFLSVMGNLFLMIVEVALWGIIPILLSIGKHDEAKSAFRPIFTFWVLYTIIGYFNECTGIVKGFGGVAVSMGVFELLIACAFTVFAVLAILSILKNKPEFKKILLFIFMGCLVLYLVTFSLRVALYAKWKMGWNSYFEVIYKYLALPFAMFFLLLHFEYTFDELKIFPEKPAPIKEETEEVPAPEKAEEEPVTEASQAEPAPEEKTEEVSEKTEEAPAEESAAEPESPAEEPAEAKDVPPEA